MICLRMGKTSKAKTLPGDFKVTTPKNPQLSQQVVTSKWILLPYADLHDWTYSVVTISHFQCIAPSTWLTNRCTDPSMWLTTNLRRMLAAKFFSSSTWWRSRSSLVTNATASSKERWIRANLSPVKMCLN